MRPPASYHLEPGSKVVAAPGAGGSERVEADRPTGLLPCFSVEASLETSPSWDRLAVPGAGFEDPLQTKPVTQSPPLPLFLLPLPFRF